MSSKALLARNAIIDLLETVQLDGEPAFAAVQGDPYGAYDKTPIVRVLPASQDSNTAAYRTTDRTVNFNVRTTLPMKRTDEFDRLYTLTDLIIDALDQADAADTFSGTLGTYMMTTTHGDWFEESSESGPMLTAEINVSVAYSKNN